MRSLASRSPRSMRRDSSCSSSAVSRPCRLTSFRKSWRDSGSTVAVRGIEFLIAPRHRAKRRTRHLYDAPVTALSPPVLPQLALSRAELPEGEGWSYEPKWDGFRAIAFVDGDEYYLQSRNGRPLGRYFPELRFPPGEYVLDGELVILGDGGRQEFDALQQRIHPAESRVRLLAEEMPARFVAFDLLEHDGKVLLDEPFTRRRERLEGARRRADRPDAAHARARGGRAVAPGRRGRDRQGARRPLPSGRAHRDGEGQARAHDRLASWSAGAPARRRARSAR